MAGTEIDAVDIAHLRRCLALARSARDHGNDPFGSLLVGPDGSVLAEHENVVHTARDVTGHPELTLVRWACAHLSPAERAASTVYTSCEHCPMCATAHYWAGVGRLVFALDGAALVQALPSGSPSLSLSVRELYSRADPATVTVAGPCADLRDEALAVHEGHWETGESGVRN